MQGYCQSKVNNLYVPVSVQHDVGHLQVPVHDALLMQFTNAYDDLSDVKLGQLFRGALVLWKDALKAAPS